MRRQGWEGMEDSVPSGVVEGPGLSLGSLRAFQENDLIFHQGKGYMFYIWKMLGSLKSPTASQTKKTVMRRTGRTDLS